MLIFTTPITIPNVIKAQISKPLFSDDDNIFTAQVTFLSPTGLVEGNYQITVTNGPCTGVRPVASSLGVHDRVEMFTTNVSGGYDSLSAAYSGIGIIAKKKSVETWLASVGLLPAGSVS